MLIVAPAQATPAWTKVMGAEVLFAPIDRNMVLRARRACRQVSQDAPSDADAVDLLDDLGDAMSHALIVAGAQDWRNVGSQRFDDDGAPVVVDGEPIFDPLPFSVDNLALALSDPATFDAFDAAYVIPYVTRERERAEPGNGFAASPNGTGEAATPVSNTATSPAPPVSADAAPSAPTVETSQKPRRKRRSGGS